MPTVGESLGRLRELISLNLPSAAAFRPPASAEDLAALSATVKQAVPDELVELLSLCDGQDDPTHLGGPINHAHFLSAAEIGATHQLMCEVLDDLRFPLQQPSAYRWGCWTAGWIPFLAFENDTYCLDLDPGTAGVSGQVFYRPNTPDLNAPLATSLTEFLALLVERIEAGAPVRNGTYSLPELY